jgi:UDPglucose 6-dehydrogenase
VETAVTHADATVVCTEWPQFREANWSQAVGKMRRALVIDANRFLEKPLQGVAGVEHISVGRA